MNPDTRLPYRSPELTVFGDVRQLTRLNGVKMGDTDGTGRFIGMSMTCQLQDAKTGAPIDTNECIP